MGRHAFNGRPASHPGTAGLRFLVRYLAEDAHRTGFDVVVIEKDCRGIDFDGSVAAIAEAAQG
jgi:hypothetical protein